MRSVKFVDDLEANTGTTTSTEIHEDGSTTVNITEKPLLSAAYCMRLLERRHPEEWGSPEAQAELEAKRMELSKANIQ